MTLAVRKMPKLLIFLLLSATIDSTIAFSIQHSKPFEKDFYEMNLNQSISSCSSSSSSSDVEIFRPEKATFTFRFKFNVISPSSPLTNSSNLIFRMDPVTGVLRMNLDQVFANTTTNSNNRYFVLKLTALDQSNSNEWQTVLAVRISELLAKQCEEAAEDRRVRDQHAASSATTRNRKRTNRPVTYAKLKLLFADSFQSYDFNQLYHHSRRTNDDSQQQNNVMTVEEEAIYLSEDLVKDSFICYVLVQSNLDIKLVGPDSATFK